MTASVAWGARRLVLGLALLVSSFSASGVDFLGPDTQLNGFVSQAFIQSEHHNFYGNSTQGSFGLTEIGANVHHRFHPQLSGSVQVISRRAGEMDDGTPRLDYALLDYRYHSTMNDFAGIRLGRVKLPVGLYNDTRDVAITRPGIMVPQSVYLEGLALRDFFLSADGALAYAHWFGASNHALQIEGGLAVPTRLSAQTRDAFLLDMPVNGSLHMDAGQAVRALYEWGGGQIRLGGTGVRVRNRYHPHAEDFITDGRIDLDVLILSGEWNRERFTLTGEGVYRRLAAQDFGPLPNRINHQNGYYLQGSYRFHPGWEAFIRHDMHWMDRRDRSGKAQAQASALLGRPQPEHAFFQRHHVVGLGWRFQPQWLLRTEWHDIYGTALTPWQENPQFSSERGKANWGLFALQLSYTF